MNDDTDKLAAQMQNLRPSKTSRESGIGAAMAAFNQEFATEKSAENAASKTAVSEKSKNNSTSHQGTADALRPTGTDIKMVTVMTRREATMAKLKSVFNFRPQTMMMAGSCAAALMAAMIVLPNMDELSETVPTQATEVVTVEKDNVENSAPLAERADVTESNKTKEPQAREEVVDEIIVTGSRLGDGADLNAAPVVVEAVTAEDIEASSALNELPSLSDVQRPPTPAPTPQGGISSVDKLLNEIRSNAATVEEENKEREAHFRQNPNQQRSLLESLGHSGQTPLSEEQAIREYRALLQQKENVKLFQFGQTPPPPPQIERQSAANNHASTNPRAENSGRTRIVVPSQGSGAQAPTSEPEKIGGLTLEIVPGKPGTTGRVNTAVKGQFTVFNGVSNEVVQSTETIVSETGEILCRVLIPAKYKTITKQVLVSPAKSEEVIIPAVTKDVVVKLSNGDGTFREVINKVVIEEERVDYVITPAKYETRSERVLVAPAREDWKPGTQAINSAVFGQPPVPPKYVLRDDDGKIVREFESRDALDIFSAELPEKIAGLTVSKSAPKFETREKTIVIQPASVEYVPNPVDHGTVSETIVVQEASTELVKIPAEYEWVDGDVEGSTTEFEVIPAEFETVTETIVVQPARVEYAPIPKTYETVKETILIRPQYTDSEGNIVPAITEDYERRVYKSGRAVERTIPAVTKDIQRRVVKTPARVVEKVVPFEKRNGKTRLVVKAASVQERVIPPVTQQMERRVIKQPAIAIERAVPAVTKTVEVQVIAPQSIVLRDEDGKVVREFKSRDAFEAYKAHLPTPVAEKPVSTFSIDVDTSSYTFLRASINRGQLPPREAIRLEEMINYFPYDYEAPKSADEPFKANVTVTSNPWNEDTKLMHIGIKGYVPKQSEKPRSNLVFLIDTSGSMRSPNKLPLLINSFKLLLNTLDEDDTVSIVTYASSTGTVLEPTRVKNKAEILAALNNLRAGGSTAGAAGLELAYQNAQENFDDEGVNRVILATDGDFNVGFSSPDDMKTFVEKKRETGIFLSVLGFGMGNYNDHLMQSLAQNGNGVAAYIDTLAEANKVLADEAGGALFTIAKDVKIQVEFNPTEVAEYRLIGYETRALKRQDFNNDKVDAGEIGAGHSVTAIYEMTPVGSPAVTVDKLRYVSETPTSSTGSDEYAFVKIRHKLPNADKSTLQTFPIGKRQERSLKRASDDMRFATAVAIVGQKLRGDTVVEDYSYEDAIKLAKSAKGEDENGYRAEFIQMVQLIDSLGE